MIIDKTRITTKTVGIICAISGLICLIMTIRGFALYRFVVCVSLFALTFVCFKGIGKDKEICIGIYSILAVFSIVNIFTEESFSLSTAIFLLLKIFGYIAIIIYLFGYVSNRLIPIIGASVVTFLMLRNVYVFVENFRRLQYSMNMSFGGNTNLFTPSMFFNILVTFTFVIPTAAILILVISNSMVFTDRG